MTDFRATRSSYGWAAAAAAVTFGVAAISARYLFWDSYFDLVAGRYIANHGIPFHEVLTIAGKSEWVDQQWLAHVLFYGGWLGFGYAGTALISVSATALAFGLLAALMISQGIPESRAFIWSLAALGVALGSTVIRAQSLALPLAVILAWLVIADARRPRFDWRLLAVVPLVLVWANVHGSVLLGAGLGAGYCLYRASMAVGRRDRQSSVRYFGVGLAVSVAVLVTPYGATIFDYYGSLLANGAVQQYILEWAPPQFGNPFSVGFFAMLGVTVVIVLYSAARRYRPPLVLLAPALILGALGLTALRFATWFGLAAALLDANILAGTRARPPQLNRAVIRLGGALVFAAAALAAVALVATPRATFEQDLPLSEMAAIANLPSIGSSPRILTDESGSALLWLYPQTAGHVGFDARLEQYSPDALLAWFQFLNGVPPGWPSAAADYDVILLSGKRPQLVTRLSNLPGWSALVNDEEGALFVRSAAN